MTTAMAASDAGEARGVGRSQGEKAVGKQQPDSTDLSQSRDGRHRSALPPDFDVEAWTRQACRRSGVTFAVTDPVALEKLRVLTRRDE